LIHLEGKSGWALAGHLGMGSLGVLGLLKDNNFLSEYENFGIFDYFPDLFE